MYTLTDMGELCICE